MIRGLYIRTTLFVSGKLKAVCQSQTLYLRVTVLFVTLENVSSTLILRAT